MVIPTSKEAIEARKSLTDVVSELYPGSSLVGATEVRETVQHADGSFSECIQINPVGPDRIGPTRLARLLKEAFTRGYHLGKKDAIAHLTPEAETK